MDKFRDREIDLGNYKYIFSKIVSEFMIYINFMCRYRYGHIYGQRNEFRHI